MPSTRGEGDRPASRFVIDSAKGVASTPEGRLAVQQRPAAQAGLAVQGRLAAIPARHFSTTRWSLVQKAAGPGGRQALSELFRAYWQPVRLFVQGHGISAEDAADVTQELFENLLL